jgi:hypothetical protein
MEIELEEGDGGSGGACDGGACDGDGVMLTIEKINSMQVSVCRESNKIGCAI